MNTGTFLDSVIVSTEIYVVPAYDAHFSNDTHAHITSLLV